MQITDSVEMELKQHKKLGEIFELTVTNIKEVLDFSYKHGVACTKIRISRETALDLAEFIVNQVNTTPNKEVKETIEEGESK